MAHFIRETSMIEHIAQFCIRRRAWVAGVLLALTLTLGWFALHIEVRTVFEDMLPSRHEYVQTLSLIHI